MGAHCHLFRDVKPVYYLAPLYCKKNKIKVWLFFSQEKEKYREIVSLLGAMDEDQFAKLAGLGRRITDYGTDKQASAGGV